jgi:hypothetical protein
MWHCYRYIRSLFISHPHPPTSYDVKPYRMPRCKQASRARMCRKITIGLQLAYKCISKILWILTFRLLKFFCHWKIFPRTTGKGHNISDFILFNYYYYYFLQLRPSTLPVYPFCIYSSFLTTTPVKLKQWIKLHFYPYLLYLNNNNNNNNNNNVGYRQKHNFK